MAAAPPPPMYFSKQDNFQDSYHSAPLFECIGHDEVAELRECHLTIQDLETRCSDLNRINIDLEKRLESQAKGAMLVDREIVEMKRAWEESLKGSEKEANEWKERLMNEMKHSEAIREKLRRTEKELHRMLQRKYEIVQAAKAEERNSIMEKKIIARDLQRQSSSSVSALRTVGARPSPSTSNPIGAGFDGVREKQVVDSLSDFFGL